MSDQWIVIPGWETFQHRDATRSRVPTWIKNYPELLHKDEYLDLTLAQRGLLHGLWLMFAASKSQGVTTTRTRYLLATNKAEAQHFSKNLKALSDAGFIQLLASKPASDVASAPASLEKRREDKNPPSIPPSSPPAVTEHERAEREDRKTGYVKNLSSYTGCRYVRGEMGVSAKYDPLGTERPPNDWPHERPTRAEVLEALNERSAVA